MSTPLPSQDLRDRLRRRFRDPIFWNDQVQLAKTVAAAVIAWVVAASVLELPQPFLAPWAALLVVHATVFRTFSQGARQVAATALGVVLAWLVGDALGLDTISVAIALMLGLLVGAFTWFEDQETTIAATALVVLTTGFSQDDTHAGLAPARHRHRHRRRAARQRRGLAAAASTYGHHRDRQGRRPHRSAADADARRPARGGRRGRPSTRWVEETRSLDGDLDNAWALVRQAQESARMNPRRSAREVRQPQQWFSLLRRMEQAVAEQRSMARTLGRSLERGETWDDTFREGWLELLRDAGRAIQDASSDDLLAVRGADRRPGRAPSRRLDPLPALWPEYGALLFNLRNVVDTMDEVAAANPLGQPPLPVRLPPVAVRAGVGRRARRGARPTRTWPAWTPRPRSRARRGSLEGHRLLTRSRVTSPPFLEETLRGR